VSAAAGTDPAAGAGRPQSGARRGWLVAAVALAIAIAFPLLDGSDEGTMSIAFYVLIFMAAVSAWNIFSGYSGYLALGHAIFFGVGAYMLAIAAVDWNVTPGWTTLELLPLCGVAAAVIAVPVGLIALRTRRHVFVVLTIAVFFIFQTLATNLSSLTGGTAGKSPPFNDWSYPAYNVRFYYVALALVVPTVLLSWLVRRSRFGLQLMAIRDDEDRARGLGVKTMPVKLAAFVLSAIPVGIAGGIYCYFLGGIQPAGSGSAFDPLFDIALALMGFLGGIGTIAGPLLGALVIEALTEKFTQLFSNAGWYLIIDGVLFVIVVAFLPRGIVPSATDRVRAWRVKRAASAGAGVAEVAP
jgi:branched-chain amino acid transport system permease protein